MNWKTIFARDSALWVVLFYGGLVVTAISLLPNPQEYGIPAVVMPYARLLALIAAIVGGKNGLSFAGSKRQILDNGK
jgi:hypothetical protein